MQVQVQVKDVGVHLRNRLASHLLQLVDVCDLLQLVGGDGQLSQRLVLPVGRVKVMMESSDTACTHQRPRGIPTQCPEHG